jgi:hypothetical protein
MIGFALTGFFPWLMFSWALYQRQRKQAAALAVLVNLGLLLLFIRFSLKATCPWWVLVPTFYGINLLWAVSVWVIQIRTLGHARKRYMREERSSWVNPLWIGTLAGFCISSLFSVPHAMVSRWAMLQTLDTLNHASVLWDAFSYSLWGAAAGLLLGWWWAGEGKSFRPGHIITFVCALPLTLLIWILGFEFLGFLAYRGHAFHSALPESAQWALVPPWATGVEKFLGTIQTFDITVLIVVPLLFGTVSRLRDFAKRALLIPLAFVSSLPMIFIDNDWWSLIQGQIVYEMHAPDAAARAEAAKWSEILLSRYTNHGQWPSIAQSLADYYGEQGQKEKAIPLFEIIVRDYRDSNQWHWNFKLARASLAERALDASSGRTILEMPVVGYEEYLSHNWMALLSVMRYWEGIDVAESTMKLRLKDLSRNDDKIDLNPLAHMADLDDAARSLGYEVLIFSTDAVKIKSLISAGIPVIHQSYDAFNVIFGFDEGQHRFCAYSFRRLSNRLRGEPRKEIADIMPENRKGLDGTEDRLTRTANEVRTAYPFDLFQDGASRYCGPLMAVVIPKRRCSEIANALKTPVPDLKRAHEGFLASLIGYSFLNHGDPIRCVEWAKRGAERIDDPMPLHAAFLAKTAWDRRRNNIMSGIPLQDQFPELKEILVFFAQPDHVSFLERAEKRFKEDMRANRLPWFIADWYVDGLDMSNPENLNNKITILKNGLMRDPSHYTYWKELAVALEWAQDKTGLVQALEGLVSCRPYDEKAKLQLAYGRILLKDYQGAKEILKVTDASKVRYDADYPFCLGAIAQWEGRAKSGRREFEKAIAMRSYKPVYHLKYGQILLSEGQKEQARVALQWAARIDAGGAIRKEAELILAGMENG